MLSVRRLMTGTCPSPKPHLRVLLALVFVLTIQALALNHLIGHSARGDNAGCAICVSASHAGNAVPASAIEIHILQLADRPAIPAVAGQVRQAPPAVYRSRAPPAFA